MNRMQPLTEGQLRSLLEISKDDPKTHAIVTFMSRHFIRATELTMLKASDVCLEDRTISIKRLKGSISKIESFQPGDYEALSVWLAVKPKSLYLFPGRNGEKMDRKTVFNIFRAATRKAGIPR